MDLKVINTTITEGNHVIFLNLGVLPGKKVDSYLVLTKTDRTKLGDISWYDDWRKYVFVPDEQIMFEETYLRDIADFLEARTRELKIN